MINKKSLKFQCSISIKQWWQNVGGIPSLIYHNTDLACHHEMVSVTIA